MAEAGMKKTTATVMLKTWSEVDGRRKEQVERGGNLSVPAQVQVEVRTGHESFTVSIDISEDGKVTARETHSQPGPKKTQEIPKVDVDV